jgi:hypothetical protein
MVAHRMPLDLHDPARRLAWGGGALALVIAALLFTQFSIEGNLSRDEAIYTYGGQQLVEGVPVYEGIFDPKPPLPTFLTAAGVATAHAVGEDEIVTLRYEFLLFSLLTVAAVYLLALRLWRSPVAALGGAVTFVVFRGFASDALGGPGAKTPGVLLSVVALLLLVQRRWFWAALVGSLAFLDWQPLGIYAIAAVVAAFVLSEARWREAGKALAGAAIPLAGTLLYLVIAGDLSQFFEASFDFPATGLDRDPISLWDRIGAITHVVNKYYPQGRILFWAGLALLPFVLLRRRVRRPTVVIVLTTLLVFVALTLTDFQGYPDLFPLLPYAAIGIAGVVAIAIDQRGMDAVVVALVAMALLSALTFKHYLGAIEDHPPLSIERYYANRVDRLIGPGQRLYALGDPTVLVLTGRRNPTRWIYLGSGVDEWAIKHDFGSFAAWKAEISAVDPPVIVMNTWASPRAVRMAKWVERTYGPPTTVGTTRFYVKPSLRERATRLGI